jgi:hypothetical protein
MPNNASYVLPEGINPPCTCDRHDHRGDDDGLCDYPIDNDPASWGFCGCQHTAGKPVTLDKYMRWQADIHKGRIGPGEMPKERGLSY